MQYGVHPYKDEGCGTCKHYDHSRAYCLVDWNSHERAYPMPIGLSPCKSWVKGFVFRKNSWGQFDKITTEVKGE